MSPAIKLCLYALVWLSVNATCLAQLTIPPTPLTISDTSPIVQTPAYANFADPQCDRNGTIYMRHESNGDNSWELASVSSDGSAEQIRLAAVPGLGDTHTFAMATSDGGVVHEVVRAWDGPDKSDTSSIIYLEFDADGSFRSRQRFAQEFIPTMLLPLPSGNFFATGVLVKKQPGMKDTEEIPLAGIFDSEARLKAKLGSSARGKNGGAGSKSQADSESEEDATPQVGQARLGDDGDIYVLLSTVNPRVRVYRQTGEFRREITLQQPFKEGSATDLWISGGRLLVTYEDDASDPKDAITYIVYDKATGQLIRAYRPQFTGAVACFEDGQSVTVLMNQKYSGRLTIGTVELQ